MRQSVKRRAINDNRRRTMKEAVKGIKKLVTAGDAKAVKTDLAKAYQAIDKAVKRGVIKKNTGARKKSRLVGFIKRNSA